MKRKISKLISLLLTVSFLVSFSACGGIKGNSQQSKGSGAAQSSASPDASAAVYPLKTTAVVKLWTYSNQVPGKFSEKIKSPFFEGLMKRTGVKLEIIEPAIGQEKDAFNLMVASGDLPDIVQYGWVNFPGGPQKAIDDGVILELNDVFDKYAPNIRKTITSDKELDKMVKTDSGKYYVFPFIRGDEYLQVYQGPFLRKDWLNDLGLKVPVTMDEWYTVLKAFKEKKGAAAPLAMNTAKLNEAFSVAFKLKNDFYYDDNGKLLYGPIQPQFKEYLATLKKWYAEGLLDKDFAVINQATMDANMMSGKSGATIGGVGGTLGKYFDGMAGKDDKYDLTAALYPVLKSGETPFTGHSDPKYSGGGSANAAITKSCKNVEVAAKFLDYGYTGEGKLYVNFGEEGLAHTMVNGYPTYAEIITKNPEKLTMNQALSAYTMATGYAAVQDKRYMEQFAPRPQQKEAIQTWMKADRKKHDVPIYAVPSTDKAAEYAKIMTSVQTFRDESMVKFILGTDSLDNYDKYVEQIKKLGIDRATEIKAEAVDKYNKR